MSGSPIIQNGAVIGAVTHVFVQDSTKGDDSGGVILCKNALLAGIVPNSG